MNHCYVKLRASPVGSTLRSWSLLKIGSVARTGVDLSDDLEYSGIEECGPSRCYSEEVLGCLDRETAVYPERFYPDAAGLTLLKKNSGPNSNTFARTVSSRCGVPAPVFANELTAPGWTYGQSIQ